MKPIVTNNEHKVKVCVLSYPEELVRRFVQKLLQQQEDSTYRNFAALGISISTIKAQSNENKVKVILLQTSAQKFLDKLRLYYHGASGAIILFDKNNNDSFEAAKRFFQYFRKVTLNPLIPVIFIDVEKSREILFNEPERLEDNPNIQLYEINENDLQTFSNIIDGIIDNYFETQLFL